MEHSRSKTNVFEQASYKASYRWGFQETRISVGLLQIYKLRDDYRKVEGTDFTPLEFHDEFVKQGSIPIRAVRRILRGNNEPTI
jgi:Bacterial protein of unknown function (DUF885)